MISSIGLLMSLNDPQWGNRGKDGGGRGPNQGPPDLEELWRDFNRRLSGMFGNKGRGGNSGGGDGPGFEFSPKLFGGGLSLIIGLIAVVWLASDRSRASSIWLKLAARALCALARVPMATIRSASWRDAATPSSRRPPRRGGRSKRPTAPRVEPTVASSPPSSRSRSPRRPRRPWRPAAWRPSPRSRASGSNIQILNS